MKRSLHKVRGKDIKSIMLVANRFGTTILMTANSELDPPREEGKHGPSVHHWTTNKEISIKLDKDLLLNYLCKTCVLHVRKARTWWHVDTIESDQQPARCSVKPKSRR